MKIVFLTSSLNAGGAERVASTLCNAWSARGDDVTLIPTFSGGGKPFYALSDQVELVSLAQASGVGGKSLRSYLRRLLTLRRLIRERAPDLVVSFLPNVNVAAVLATAFSGIPCIVCERSDPSSRSRWSPWELACRLVYRHADMLTVQTDAVARQAALAYPGVRRLRVVPNPLVLPAMPQATAESRNQANPRKKLLSLGRLSSEKRVDRIIDAFAEQAYVHPEWDLDIYGDGPLAAQLQLQAAQLGLEPRIAFHGRTSAPAEVYPEADAFVMASEYEGFPNALLEAMGAGLACIAVDCASGPREMSRDGRDVLLVEPEDRKALSQAMDKLMADSGLRTALGAQAQEAVLARYSLPSVLTLWDRLFDEVLAQSRHRRPGRAAAAPYSAAEGGPR